MSDEPKTMEEKVSAIHTDMKWVKEVLHKKANKWVEKVLGLMMFGATAWVIGQLLNLIPKVKALL